MLRHGGNRDDKAKREKCDNREGLHVVSPFMRGEPRGGSQNAVAIARRRTMSVPRIPATFANAWRA
jgi:hypothetical protein